MNQSRVFLDASFWIALRDVREPWHSRAKQATAELLRNRTRLIFTSFVLAETHAFFSRSQVLRAQILEDAETNRALMWEPVSRQDELDGIALLRQHRDKQWSLCDAISFALMRRLEIGRAATFDKHFEQIGEFQIVA